MPIDAQRKRLQSFEQDPGIERAERRPGLPEEIVEMVGDEFLVLILGRTGLVDRFAVDSADWSETAPLGRFELVGRSLYRLGSTQEGAFVDRFDLEVPQ